MMEIVRFGQLVSSIVSPSSIVSAWWMHLSKSSASTMDGENFKNPVVSFDEDLAIGSPAVDQFSLTF